MARKGQVAREAWLLNTKAAPLRSCLAESWEEDYAKSSNGLPVGKQAPNRSLSWPGRLDSVSTGKFFVFDKMLIPEARIDHVVHEWHDQRLLHPGLEKMRLHLKRCFKFPPGLWKALKAVFGSCQVCQAVKLPNQSQAGNADCSPLPDVPMEGVVIYKFTMSPVRHGKEVEDCDIPDARPNNPHG